MNSDIADKSDRHFNFKSALFATKMPPDSKSSMSSLYRRFLANFTMLQERDAEAYRLKQETLDQKHRIDELVKQTQRSNELGDENHKVEIAQLHEKLHSQDLEMIEAEQTIEMLIRDVQVAREVASRAEKAQREAEADQMFRHVLKDSDDEGAELVTVKQLRSELKRVKKVEQQSSHRASELEQELTVLRDAADMLSVELQASKHDRHEMKLKTHNELETLQELKAAKTKADEVVEHWKAMAGLREAHVSTLQDQVKALRSDKNNLENAIALCERSANKRLEVLEHDRQKIETKNARLLTELTSIQRELKAMSLKYREIEEGFGERAELEEELEKRLARAQTRQEQIASRIVEVEQKLVVSTSATESADQNQCKGLQRQHITEKNELLQQLQEERRRSSELKSSASVLKKATESALKELKDVEIELRAIGSDCVCSDGQHETLADLARQVIAECKRQGGASVEALAASMQVQYLTSLMHAHLNRLSELREHQKVHFASMSSSDSDSDSDAHKAHEVQQYDHRIVTQDVEVNKLRLADVFKLTKVAASVRMTQVFAADDKFADVVMELEARGWRRLPFIGCPKFDLKWTKYSKIAWRRVTSTQIVNHLQHSILFSQKDQFTQLLYTHAADHSQTQVDRCFPRTFDLSRPRDQRLLERWFRYNHAVAVLKESLSEKPTVDVAQVEAAVRLTRTVIDDGEYFENWRKEGYAAGRGGDASESQRSVTGIDGSREEALDILNALKRLDPQFHTVGSTDSNVWICKPSNLSQGRGIVLCNSLRELALITSPGDDQKGDEILQAGKDRKMAAAASKWIVQKYIERPLLLQNGRKFDIRQWVLITEIEPTPKVFWFYRSYLRFCSCRFELTRLEDRFAHLSNHSVQQHFVPGEIADADLTRSTTTASSYQEDKFALMWFSEQLQDVLRAQYGRDVWSETILPQMQNTARLALSAVLPKVKAIGKGFEWLGFDFLVDENFHVWLLEVNVSPDVSHSTIVTAELVPKATADALNVVLDPETSRYSDNGWLPFLLHAETPERKA